MVKVIKKKKKEIAKDDYIPLPEKIYDQIMANMNSILAGVGVLVLVISVIWGIVYFSEKKDEEASGLFSKAVNAYWEQVKDANPANKEQTSASQSPADFSRARNLLQRVAEDYKSTVYGKWSELYIGNCYRYEDNLGKAEEHYLAFIKKYGKSDLISLQAYQKLAVTLIDEGKYEDAVKYCNDYIGENSAIAIDQFLFRIALCYEKMNNLRKAQTYYKRVIEEYPDSALNNAAKDRDNNINVLKMQGL